MAAARDYQRLREINVLLIKTTWAVGRNRQLCCVSGPVSALSLAPQIQKTGKYFNCKQPRLHSLRGPQAAQSAVYSPALLPASLHVCMRQCTVAACNYPSKPSCTGILALTMPHVISDTCILQLPSKSNIIQISQDASRRGAAWRILLINPRLHPIRLHQVRDLRRAGKIGSFGLPRISGRRDSNY